MRILMITDDVQIDRRILQEAETLISDGHEVILLAAPADNLTSHELLGNVKVERARPTPCTEGIPEKIAIRMTSLCIAGVTRCVAVLRRYLLGVANKLKRALLTLLESMRRVSSIESELARRIMDYRPDCVHVHGLPQLGAGVYAKRSLGVPLIYDSHELYVEIGSLTPKEKKVLRRRERRYIRKADATVTVNPMIARELAERYRPRSVTVVQNAVDPPPGFDAEHHHNRFRQCLPIANSDKILLYQGRIAGCRELNPLVESIPGVRADVHVVFMGDGEDHEKLRKLAQELGVASRVHFVPAVSQAELFLWTASADAGIIPHQPDELNHWYASPNKLYEFIQAGLPILANDLLCVLRSVIESEAFGMVRKLDTPHAYAEAINAMMGDSQKLAFYRRNMLARRHLYSWRHESQNLLKVYEQLFGPGCLRVAA